MPIILLVFLLASLFFIYNSQKSPTPKSTSTSLKTQTTDISKQVKLAQTAFDKNQFEEMVKHLDPVKESDDPTVQSLLGFAYAGIKDFPAAAAAFERALAKKRDVTYGYSLAYIYETMLEYEKARNLYLDLSTAPLGKSMMIKVKLGAARCSLGLNDFQKAIKLYKEVLELDPTREEPYIEILKLMRLARNAKDVGILRQKGDLFLSKNFQYQFNLGTLYYEVGDYDNAAKAFKAAIEINSNNSSPFYFLYKILKKTKKIEEAVAELEKFYALNPFLPYIFFEAALDAKEQGRLDLAFKFFRSAITMDRSLLGRDDKGTLYAIEKFLKEKGTPVEQEFFKAFFNFVNGDFTKAANLIKPLIPKIQDTRLKEDAERMYRECQILLRQEQSYNAYMARLQNEQQAAMAKLRATLAERKGTPQTHGDLAISSRVDELKRQAMLNPKDIKLQYRTALDLARLGDLEGAKLFLRETIRLDPNVPEAYYSLAKLAYHQGNKVEAAEHISEALRRAPNHSQSLSFSALINLERGDIERAQKEAEAAISSNPNNGEAHLVLARVFAETQPDRAIAEIAYGLAVETNPQLVAEFKKLETQIKQKK